MTLLIQACNSSEKESSIAKNSERDSSDLIPVNVKKNTEDIFKLAVEDLKSVNYFMTGKDSFKVSKAPTEFIEMNGIRYCFKNSFDKSDTGLIAYKNVTEIKKYFVAKDKKRNGPSANIIQISFPDAFSATKWFTRLKSCSSFEAIKVKPKTEIWQQVDKVYFIQSYYDPDRVILETIVTKFTETLN